MGAPVLGAHTVAYNWLYACARVAGVCSVLFSYLCAAWVWLYGATIFRDAAIWSALIEFIGDYRIVGIVIFIGAMLGTLGLVTRHRWMSYTSAVVGAFWAGWLMTFLGIAHFWRREENIAVLFAGAVMVMFLLRFWLLVITPEKDEPRGRGW